MYPLPEIEKLEKLTSHGRLLVGGSPPQTTSKMEMLTWSSRIGRLCQVKCVKTKVYISEVLPPRYKLVSGRNL